MVLFALAAIAPSPIKQAQQHTSALASSQQAAPVSEAKIEPQPIETPKPIEPKPFDVNDRSTWPVCPENQIVWAQDGLCHEKAAEPMPVAQASPSTATVSASGRVPVGVHDVGGSGDCAAEIAKYNWGQSVALAVSRAESGLRPGVINNNPGTGDYSIGCFQVNIAGRNAINRPSQAELINAATNVRWAYNNYVGNGSSFLGQWGVCRKISCY